MPWAVQETSVTLILSYVWITCNPSLFFLWVIKFKNSPQRRWSCVSPELVYPVPVPSMVFILKNYLFLKRVHWRCHPSYQQPHWALVSDIQTVKLKSSFRRELLKFKWAGHIEEESARLHAHLCSWPSHLVPQSRRWFCFCKWALEAEVSLPRPPAPLGSSLVVCGLNRFSSESSQQTWQEGSPLPQPENAKNPTGKMAVFNALAGCCCTAVSSKAAYHSISVPTELPASEQSQGFKNHRQAWHSKARTPERFGENLFLPRNVDLGLGGQNDILFARKGKEKTFLKALIWSQFLLRFSCWFLSHYNDF